MKKPVCLDLEAEAVAGEDQGAQVWEDQVGGRDHRLGHQGRK